MGQPAEPKSPAAAQDGYRAYVERQVKNICRVLAAVADGRYDQYATSEKADVFGNLSMVTNVVVNAVNRAVQELQASNARAREEAAEKDRLLQELKEKISIIERQNQAIADLTTPVLQVWDHVLVLPLIGIVDSARSQAIMERLLQEISEQAARCVIIDITGLDFIDTRTADYLLRMVKSAQLLGTRCIITGVRPAVAQTLVEIGAELPTLTTLRNLQEGLRACLGREELPRLQRR